MSGSYTSFMRSLKDGDVVHVRHHPSQQEADVELLVASTHIGLHFWFHGILQVIPVVAADRVRLRDGGTGIDIYRNDGTLWWSVSKGVVLQDNVL